MTPDPQRIATLLLDFARQKGVLGSEAEATLRAGLGEGGDPAALTATLVAEHRVAREAADDLRAQAEEAAALPAIDGFRIIGPLGRGAHGTVWRAEQQALGRQVALKVVRIDRVRDAERFLHEVRVAGSVSSRNVVTCHDAGRQGDHLFLAMELVDGADAAAYARSKGGRLAERVALSIIRDAALGLQAIAAAGLVHRDLKPANLLLDRQGHAKIADLGIARSLDEQRSLTRTGEFAGTPAYMSPEQVRGGAVDLRSDLWSLGATFYALLVGEPPYAGASAIAVLGKVLNEPPPDPARRLPGISRGAHAIIRAAMQPDRDRRYASPSELHADCVAVLAGGEAANAARLLAAPDAPASGRRGLPLPVALVAAAALLVVGTLAGWLTIRAPIDHPLVVTARDAGTAAAWQECLAQDPDGPHAAEARAALAVLERIAAIDAPAASPDAVQVAGLDAARARVDRARERLAAITARVHRPASTNAPAPAPIAIPAPIPTPAPVPVAPAIPVVPTVAAAPPPVVAPAVPAPPVVPAAPVVPVELDVLTTGWCEAASFDPRGNGAVVARVDGVLCTRADDEAGWMFDPLGHVERGRWKQQKIVGTARRMFRAGASPDLLFVLVRVSVPFVGLLSEDGGRTLVPVPSPWPGSADYTKPLWHHTCMLADGTLIAFKNEDDGVLHISANRGRTWRKQAMDLGISTAVVPMPKGAMILVGDSSQNQRTSIDLGRTWLPLAMPPDLMGPGFSVGSHPNLAVPWQGGLLIALNGCVLALDAAGRRTLLQACPQLGANGGYPTALAVHPGDPKTWYVLGHKLGMLRTLDAGLTWYRLRSDIPFDESMPEPFQTRLQQGRAKLVFSSKHRLVQVDDHDLRPDLFPDRVEAP